jgi:hypothetical protein
MDKTENQNELARCAAPVMATLSDLERLRQSRSLVN